MKDIVNFTILFSLIVLKENERGIFSFILFVLKQTHENILSVKVKHFTFDVTQYICSRFILKL